MTHEFISLCINSLNENTPDLIKYYFQFQAVLEKENVQMDRPWRTNLQWLETEDGWRENTG